MSAKTGTEARIATTDKAIPQDWAWLCAGCIHAQTALAVGDSDAIQTAYEGLLPASGMIAATGSFDAEPVDGYLADLADRTRSRPRPHNSTATNMKPCWIVKDSPTEVPSAGLDRSRIARRAFRPWKGHGHGLQAR